MDLKRAKAGRPLNEGLPTKGRRGSPSTCSGCCANPQRRPPHEGEASSGSCTTPSPSPTLNEGLPTKGRRAQRGLEVGGVVECPQRRPPHEGEASGRRTRSWVGR